SDSRDSVRGFERWKSFRKELPTIVLTQSSINLVWLISDWQQFGLLAISPHLALPFLGRKRPKVMHKAYEEFWNINADRYAYDIASQLANHSPAEIVFTTDAWYRSVTNSMFPLTIKLAYSTKLADDIIITKEDMNRQEHDLAYVNMNVGNNMQGRIETTGGGEGPNWTVMPVKKKIIFSKRTALQKEEKEPSLLSDIIAYFLLNVPQVEPRAKTKIPTPIGYSVAFTQLSLKGAQCALTMLQILSILAPPFRTGLLLTKCRSDMLTSRGCQWQTAKPRSE
ncbi:hypothetical protein C0J52_21111, partial [Blattella germanica]